MDREELGKHDFLLLDAALTQYIGAHPYDITERWRAHRLREQLREAHTAWLEFEETCDAHA